MRIFNYSTRSSRYFWLSQLTAKSVANKGETLVLLLIGFVFL